MYSHWRIWFFGNFWLMSSPHSNWRLVVLVASLRLALIFCQTFHYNFPSNFLQQFSAVFLPLRGRGDLSIISHHSPRPPWSKCSVSMTTENLWGTNARRCSLSHSEGCDIKYSSSPRNWRRLEDVWIKPLLRTDLSLHFEYAKRMWSCVSIPSSSFWSR